MKTKQFNQILDSLGRDRVPAKYNLTFTHLPNQTMRIESPQGEWIASGIHGVALVFEDRQYNYPITAFGQELEIVINPSEYRAYTSTYVGVREKWNPQRTLWEMSSGFKSHIMRKPDGRYALKNRKGSKFVLEGDFITLFRDLESSRPDVVHYHVKNSQQQWGLANHRGRLILPVKYTSISQELLFYQYRIIAKDDTAGIVNEYGKVWEWGRFQSIEKFKSTGSIYLEKFLVGANGKYGLMDNTLKIGIPVNYDTLTFAHRLAYTDAEEIDAAQQPVILAYNNGLYAVYNINNERVIPPNYTHISLFAKDIYLAENPNEKALYTIEGERLSLEPFTIIDWFPTANNNHVPEWYMVKTAAGDLIWYSAEGVQKKVLDYDDFRRRSKTGLYSRTDYLLVEKDGKWGAINKNGEEIISPKYDSLNYFNHSYLLGQQLIKFYVNDSLGLLTLSGDTFLAPAYTEAYVRPDHPDGQLILIQNGKKGLADREGQLLIPIAFDAIESPTIGQCIVVRKADKVGVYSKQGELLAPVAYRHYISFRDASKNQMVIHLYNNAQRSDLHRVACE